MKVLLRFTMFFFGSAVSIPVLSQTNTYILNGSAAQNSCNCYTLTQPTNFQGGSVWNVNKINLNNPFDFWFNVYLGCIDVNGADGIVFMLQQSSTGLGASGGGMGFQGVTPSIGITLDTWQNTEFNDPPDDHISIQANGVIAHGSDVAGPVNASASSPNIEDCQWHTMRIEWHPATKEMIIWFDGNYRLKATIDLVANVFNNDPMVYWGFSGATGGSVNLQQFCTALNPIFSTNVAANGTCFGNPVTFIDQSASFGPIQSYFWDFGDGATSTLESPPPHLYASPGAYEAQLAIVGLDGCMSDTFQRTINIGAMPVADFEIFDTCLWQPPRIIDKSTSAFGNIIEWTWILDGNIVSNAQFPQLTDISVGPHELKLAVKTHLGCTSDTARQIFLMREAPVVDALFQDGCVNEPISFNATQLDNATMVIEWNWKFADGTNSQQQNLSKSFSKSGSHELELTGVASNGCASRPVIKSIFINEAQAFAGNDTMAIKNEPMQLLGTGGGTYNWTPSTGLNDPTLANPLTVLQDDMTYMLTVTTPEGCTDTDEVIVSVFKGSAIYVPSGFTPNGDGLNDLLKPLYIGIKKLYQFTIFNRWGEMIFTTKTVNDGWDGAIRGTRQATGTFVWMLKAEDYIGKVYELKGTVTIIR